LRYWLKASTFSGHVIKVSKVFKTWPQPVKSRQFIKTGSYVKNFNTNLGTNHFLKNFKHPMPKKWAWIDNAQCLLRDRLVTLNVNKKMTLFRGQASWGANSTGRPPNQRSKQQSILEKNTFKIIGSIFC
jgi:hypothetical protein